MLLMTEEDLNVVLEYARDTRVPTENFKTYKNSTDLAKRKENLQNELTYGIIRLQ